MLARQVQWHEMFKGLHTLAKQSCALFERAGLEFEVQIQDLASSTDLVERRY